MKAVVAVTSTLAIYMVLKPKPKPDPIVYKSSTFRSRLDNLRSMRIENYDLLIIGGGATGAGVALEAASRGLKSCLIEKGDFSSQTSSKSTKLLHGGVRYLEKAVKLDHPKENLSLVIEGLRERSIVMNSAQHMTSWVRLAIPCNSYFDLGFYFCGQLVYHLLALLQFLPGPAIPWPKLIVSHQVIPNLKQNVGSVIYIDGQMNDCRLCIEVLTTASRKNYTEHFEPCHIANYVQFLKFKYNDNKIVAAKVRDLETGEIFLIKSKVFVNCTGPFSDSIRRMGGYDTDRIVPGKGSHLILPKKYTPDGVGMLIPKTQDGRVLFLVPWENCTILGTTDEPGKVSENSVITREERLFLVEELARAIDVDAEEIDKDILASFSGERPLVKSSSGKTKDLLRSHEVELNENGLVSVLGGKWTTFRAMGEEAVAKAIDFYDLQPRSASISSRIVYKSNHDLIKTAKDLQTQYKLPLSLCEYLIGHYGNYAETIINLGTDPIIPGHPFISGEVLYAIRQEYALHPIDILARRIRLALINLNFAELATNPIAQIMARELHWSKLRTEIEIKRTKKELQSYLSPR